MDAFVSGLGRSKLFAWGLFLLDPLHHTSHPVFLPILAPDSSVLGWDLTQF